MTTKIYYKVKIGYSTEEYISIGEEDLPKAMRAMVRGGVAIFNEGAIAGDRIIMIVPDWNRIIGRRHDNRIDGEDWARLPADVKERAHGLMQGVREQLTNGETQRLSGKLPDALGSGRG